jgi:hypothetical protein
MHAIHDTTFGGKNDGTGEVGLFDEPRVLGDGRADGEEDVLWGSALRILECQCHHAIQLRLAIMQHHVTACSIRKVWRRQGKAYVIWPARVITGKVRTMAASCMGIPCEANLAAALSA